MVTGKRQPCTAFLYRHDPRTLYLVVSTTNERRCVGAGKALRKKQRPIHIRRVALRIHRFSI